MNLAKFLMVTAVTLTLSAPAMASAASETQRDVNQQQRIEHGLDSGTLTTREAAKLEHGEAHIDHLEAKAMKDGTLTVGEKAHIQELQNRQSKIIYGQKHDEQTGNPNSPSSQRMQADVQRDINQEKRINAGIRNGTLTNREAARLEAGRARNERAQWRAGRDGRISAQGQHRLQRQENQTSRGTWRKKHNSRDRHTLAAK